jgi:imidazolonepropionase-like amidohydrolase
MVRRTLPTALGAAFTTLLAGPVASVAQSSGEPLVLRGGMLVDGYEAPPIHHAAVVVRDNRIVAVGPADQVQIPAGARVIDTSGKTMLPGLVDLHTHLDLIGHGDYDRWYEFIGGTARLEEVIPIAARQMIRAGVTTAVDLGAPHVILEVRDRIRRGEIPGPRLVVSGPWITRVKLGGVPDAYQMVIRSPEEAARTAGQLLDQGSDVIKTWVGLTEADLRAVVETAHARGAQVHTHLYEPEAIRSALAAGVDVLHHVGSGGNPPYDDALVREIAHRGLPVVQTISHRIWVYPATERFPERLRDPRLREDMPADIHDELQASFRDFRTLSYFRTTPRQIRNSVVAARQFIEANAVMGVGTDAASPLNFHMEAMWREMAALVESGMTPLQVISAATKTGAEVLRRGAELGTLEVGKLADIIVVAGDPLSDIDVMGRVETVVKDGRILFEGGRFPGS